MVESDRAVKHTQTPGKLLKRGCHGNHHERGAGTCVLVKTSLRLRSMSQKVDLVKKRKGWQNLEIINRKDERRMHRKKKKRKSKNERNTRDDVSLLKPNMCDEQMGQRADSSAKDDATRRSTCSFSLSYSHNTHTHAHAAECIWVNKLIVDQSRLCCWLKQSQYWLRWTRWLRSSNSLWEQINVTHWKAQALWTGRFQRQQAL